MQVNQEEYEHIRDKVIAKYRVLYKDALAMDLCEVPKDVRLRLLDDPIYVAKTKAARAGLFAQQLETLDEVLGGEYVNMARTSDISGTILKALEMKNKLLLEDLNIIKDESNALNVAFVAMNREDFDALETVTVSEGGNTVELGADFGGTDETDSFETRMKKDVKERIKEQVEGRE